MPSPRAGILLDAEEDPDAAAAQEGGSVLQQACALAGCQPAGLRSTLERLLRDTVMAAAAVGAAAGADDSQREA